MRRLMCHMYECLLRDIWSRILLKRRLLPEVYGARDSRLHTMRLAYSSCVNLHILLPNDKVLITPAMPRRYIYTHNAYNTEICIHTQHISHTTHTTRRYIYTHLWFDVPNAPLRHHKKKERKKKLEAYVTLGSAIIRNFMPVGVW